MTSPVDADGYRFLPGGGFASDAVVAADGHLIERVLLGSPRPLADALDQVRAYLDRRGRSASAVCGLELRLPAPVALREFDAFNERYLDTVARLGLVTPDGPSPARTNVAPAGLAPAAPALSAFSYSVPGRTRSNPCYVVSGVADVPPGRRIPDDVVCLGRTDQDALLEKAKHALGEAMSRVRRLGTDRQASDQVALYCPYPGVHRIAREVIGAPEHGLVWHDSAAPVEGLALEIDIRRHARVSLMEEWL
jgi:hypothetical protein